MLLGQKKIPISENVCTTQRGIIRYHAGLVQKLTSERWDNEICSLVLLLTPDFTLYLSPESIPFFETQRGALQRRGALYRIKTIGILKAEYFFPEDVREAMCTYDLKRIKEQAKEMLGKN